VAKAVKPIRCAIYTRKSTEEGLDQEFSSLDAQRESGRAYIKSQASLGWTSVPQRYDDGGFTGGNMERPALHRLLADIQAGQIDCVAVYKVDRLSRSLLDFARMMATFEQHRVTFVSVTQQFNTGTSMGRLVLNVLLSFAQFEREIISERTRDKIAAARRKGKWSGALPLLGYDVDPRGSKLVVNAEEAQRVQAIFALYLQCGSLISTVQELERRGWLNKRWQTRKGHERGGLPFTKASLHHLLTNVVYLGQVKYKQEVHEGEHQGIIDPKVWHQVQERLGRRAGISRERHASRALLKGLLYCRACGKAMTPTYAAKKGGRRYGYYVCSNALQRGRQACPSRCLPAKAIERWVLERLSEVARETNPKDPPPFAKLGQWDALNAEERQRLLGTWIERVAYDGAQGKAAITFSPDNEQAHIIRRKKKGPT
jgi:site-specific DNA recombinase